MKSEKFIHHDDCQEIIDILKGHPEPQTIGMIAYWLDSDAYESGDEFGWKTVKDHVRATLKIMMLRGLIERDDTRFLPMGYTYWLAQ